MSNSRHSACPHHQHRNTCNAHTSGLLLGGDINIALTASSGAGGPRTGDTMRGSNATVHIGDAARSGNAARIGNAVRGCGEGDIDRNGRGGGGANE